MRDRISKYVNRRRIESPTFKRGDIVYLTRRYIRTKRLSDKLNFRKLRPFRVTDRIFKVNYRLELLITIRIYLVFYVTLLKLVAPGARLIIIAKIEEEEPEYKVEEILDSKLVNNNIKYLIK